MHKHRGDITEKHFFQKIPLDQKIETEQTKCKKDIFQRENTLAEIVAYLKNKKANNMPLKFWYRGDTNARDVYDYYLDEKYVNVRSEKGYFIKFLIDRIRKI